MKQVYYPWDLWEDHKHGFYNNISGINKGKLEKCVLTLFSSEELTLTYMSSVIDNWPISIEHNFTNPSINKIAYLGQCACCLAYGVPSTITMSYWRSIPKEIRDRANSIASELISEWEKNYKKCQK